MFVQKWLLEHQKVIKSYRPTYLWDSSDGCDNSDSSDSREQKTVLKKNLQENLFVFLFSFLQLGWNLKTQIVMKLKNSSCD